MIGSLLVAGFIIISLIGSITLYLNWLPLKFITAGILFIWSSSVFFISYNYEGWPTHEEYPRSQIIGIEVVEPSKENNGKIFVWVYHVNVLSKYFYEYNPENTPRVYDIEFSDEKGKAFTKAKEFLEKGYVLYIGKANDLENGDGVSASVESTNALDGDVLIPYEPGKPNIEALNPRKALKK